MVIGCFIKGPQLLAALYGNPVAGHDSLILETLHLSVSLSFCRRLTSLSPWFYGELYPLIALNMLSLIAIWWRNTRSLLVLTQRLVTVALFAATLTMLNDANAKSLLVVSNLFVLPAFTVPVMLTAQLTAYTRQQLLWSVLGTMMAAGRVATAFAAGLPDKNDLTALP